MKEPTAVVELVLVPAPAMGHLISAVELAKTLVARDPRIVITISLIKPQFNTSTVHNYVQSFKSNPGITFLDLPNPASQDSSTLFNFRNIAEPYKPILRHALLDRAQTNPPPRLAGFILDMFCTSMMDVADEFNVPSYIFFPSGAGPLSLFFHLQSLTDDNNVGVTELTNQARELEVPGFKNRVPAKLLPGVFLEKKGGSEIMINHTRRFRRAKGIIVNTFMELEPLLVKTLQEDEKIPRIYPIGPILDLSNRGGSQEEEASIVTWLDEQPPCSVVFLCFGSMGSFDEDQVKEIATALERSGQRFLWSLHRLPSAGQFVPDGQGAFVEALPKGFLERTKAVGKVIGWAPQVAVLGHEAVGGFVSHCGWNSTLESMWFGVPVATWPLYAEQQMNAFELVDETGVAVEIRMDYRKNLMKKTANMTVSAEEIEKGIRKLMETMGEEKGLRKKVKEMREKSRKALVEGGPSFERMDHFIEDVFSQTLIKK